MERPKVQGGGPHAVVGGLPPGTDAEILGKDDAAMEAASGHHLEQGRGPA